MNNNKKVLAGIVMLICLVLVSFILDMRNREKDEIVKQEQAIIATVSKEELVAKEKLKDNRTLLVLSFLVNEDPEIIADDTHFDYNNDGFKEKTEWLDSNVGILVKDIGNDDKIENGTELFGDYTNLYGNWLGLRGFTLLASEDTNNDGVINAKDKNFSIIKIWQDVNRNAIVDAGELSVLNERGIKGINLDYQFITEKDTDKKYRRYSKVEQSSKKEAYIKEIFVTVDMKNTTKPVINSIDYKNAEVKDIDVKATGTVLDLKDAMHMSDDKYLIAMIDKYTEITDIKERKKYLPNIFIAWANVTDVDPNSRGGFYDARKLEAMEKFNGERFVHSDEDAEFSNPTVSDATDLNKQFKSYLKDMDIELLSLTHYKPMLESIVYAYDYETGGYDFNVVPLVDYFREVYNVDNEKGLLLVSEIGEILLKNYSGDSFNQKLVERIRSYGLENGNSLEKALFSIGSKENEISEESYPDVILEIVKPEITENKTVEQDVKDVVPETDILKDDKAMETKTPELENSTNETGAVN